MSKGEVVPAGDWKLARQNQGGSVQAGDWLSIDQLVAQVSLIQHAMKTVMKEEEHYGKIPGVKKPSLWKSGAEKLCLLFRMDPQYESSETWDGKHLTVKSKCTLYHIGTGQRLGSGEGSCSTKESKYAYRDSKRACPQCGVEAINRSKFPPRGAPRNAQPGWYCYARQGGCGAEFDAQDSSILEQQTGRVENPDIADQYNTVLKMSNKRAHVAAVLNVTAASDLFTQDLEELRDYQPSQPLPDPEPARTYSAEEREAYARRPEPSKREKPQVDPPEDGFGDPPPEAADQGGPPPGEPRYGTPLNAKQLGAFHMKIDERAKALKIDPEAMKQSILAVYGVTSSKELGDDIWTELNIVISKFKKEDLA